MSLPRFVSASDNDIKEIIKTINYNISSIQDYIRSCIQYNGYEHPYEIVASVSPSGAYINLYFHSGLHLVFVCHQTDRDGKGQLRPNRIHCKVNNSGPNQRNPDGYCGVIFDGKHFGFKYPCPKYELIEFYKNYFFCIFMAIDAYYGLINGLRSGEKKNIKNNLKTNTVLELKNICKNCNIKNYSNQNKDGLISLIKKNNNNKKI